MYGINESTDCMHVYQLQVGLQKHKCFVMEVACRIVGPT